MSDPRLCSIHLEGVPRREEYRRARHDLLAACGEQTLAADQVHLAEYEAVRAGRADKPPSAPAGPYCLIDQDGVHGLKTGLNTIGRMPDNDIAVADGSVSRRHCAIVVHSTRGCEVYDTASKNGTFVNGDRISGLTSLKNGDKIRLCDRQFVFVANQAAAGNDEDGLTHVD